MVSGWTLPGLLSAEPLSTIMESCIESSVEDKSFSIDAEAKNLVSGWSSGRLSTDPASSRCHDP